MRSVSVRLLQNSSYAGGKLLEEVSNGATSMRLPLIPILPGLSRGEVSRVDTERVS